MSLRWADSFDHLASADMVKKYPIGVVATGADGITISSAAGRFGNGGQFAYANVTPSSTTHVTCAPSGLSSATVFAGFAFRRQTISTFDRQIFAFKETGVRHIGLSINSSSQLYITRDTTAISAATGVTILENVWYYVDLEAFINDTTGTAALYINGALRATFGPGDTRNAGTAGLINQIQIGPNPSVAIAGTFEFDIDDLYVCDNAGSVNNGRLGDVRVEALFPSGNGNSSQLVGSDANSTDNYLLVDEAAPSTADYVESSTPGDKDTYAYGDLTPAAGTVHGVQIIPYAAKTDAGARTIVSVARLSGTEEDSAAKTLSTTPLYLPDIRETKPGGGAWSISDVNSAEFGVKVDT
jgi:hypothetical protein